MDVRGGLPHRVSYLAVRPARKSSVHAALAQSAEHLTRNEKVKGSIPLGGSKESKAVILIGVHALGLASL